MKTYSIPLSRKIITLTLLIIAAIFSSGSQVYYGIHIQNFSTSLFLFISFFNTALVFLFIELLRSKNKKENVKTSKKTIYFIFYLNVATGLTYAFFYIALKYVEPAVVSAIEWGIGPVLAFLLDKYMHPKSRVDYLNLIIATGILIGTFFLVWASLTGESGITVTNHPYLTVGLIFSFITGFGSVTITYLSKKLSDEGWSTTKVISHRYYLIVLVTGVIVLVEQSFKQLEINDLNWILLIVISGTVIPIFFMQLSLKYNSPLLVLIIFALVPCLTFFIQLFDNRIEWSNYTLIGVIIITIFSITSLLKDD